MYKALTQGSFFFFFFSKWMLHASTFQVVLPRWSGICVEIFSHSTIGSANESYERTQIFEKKKKPKAV